MSIVSIFEAAENGSIEQLDQSLGSGSDINDKDEEGRTARNLCYLHGHEEMLAEIQSRNGSFNYDVLLYDGAGRGDKEAIDDALEHGANINYVHKGEFTPLGISYSLGHQELSDYLRSKGGRFHNYDWLLYYATSNGDAKSVAEALQNGAQVNVADPQDGKMALHMACQSGKAEIVEVLIENGADVNIKDKEGRTSLNISYRSRQKEIISLLKSHKAEYNYNWLLHDASCSEDSDSLEKLEEALKGGADVNFTGDNEKTALVCASERGLDKVVKILLKEKEVNVNATDKDGRTCLNLSYRNNKHEVLELLKTANAKFNNDYLIYDAAGKGDAEMANQAIMGGANVDFVGTYGTPLHKAVLGQYDKIITLMLESQADVNRVDKDGNTALHYACERCYVFAAKVLLKTGDINPAATNAKGKKPLELVPPFDERRTEILQLFAPFDSCRTEFPVESYSKVFLCGNTTAGKSSLGQVIKYRAEKLREDPEYEFDPQEDVTEKVEPLTAGIKPHTIICPKLGHVILYDFAGHREYYSSHAAILENLMLHSPAVFAILVKLGTNLSHSDIKKELYYWLRFIANVSAKLSKPAQVIVIGSHVDQLSIQGTSHRTKKSLLQEYHTLIKEIASKSQSDKFIYKGFVAMECHRPGGQGIDDFISLMAQCSKDVEDPSDSISYYCHVHYSFLLDLKKELDTVAVTVADLCSQLEKRNHPTLPSKEDQVLNYLTVLTDKGLIVFLKNNDNVLNSWVVIDQETLLNKVIGDLFAPVSIQRVHREIASNTGIISLSSLMEVFPDYESEMLVGFLTSLQFCHTFNSEVLKGTNLSPRSETDSGQLLFFPSLVGMDCPEDVSIDASFGWCLFCPEKNRFLSTRFIQVLLLSLAFCYCLEKKLGPGELEEEVSSEAKQYDRVCTIWRNGIYWMRKNIEVMVEVTDYNRRVTVLTSKRNGVEIQCILSHIIKLIRRLKRNYCPCNSKEYIIAPDTLYSVHSTDPEEPVKPKTLFSVQAIAKAIFLNERQVSDGEEKRLTDLEVLIGDDEPFLNLPPGIIQRLFDGKPSESLPKDFLQQLHYSCPLVMSSCKNQDDATYQSAIRHLQKYSIFPEGSPLVFAQSCMTGEEKEKLSELIRKPTCCQGRKPRLSDLMRFLTDEAYRWNLIGVQLDVPPGVRSGLYESNKSDETQLSEVLQYWLQHGTNHGTTSATWEIILVVVKGTLNNGRLYIKIKQFLGEDTSQDTDTAATATVAKEASNDSASVSVRGNQTGRVKDGDINAVGVNPESSVDKDLPDSSTMQNGRSSVDAQNISSQTPPKEISPSVVSPASSPLRALDNKPQHTSTPVVSATSVTETACTHHQSSTSIATQLFPPNVADASSVANGSNVADVANGSFVVAATSSGDKVSTTDSRAIPVTRPPVSASSSVDYSPIGQYSACTVSSTTNPPVYSSVTSHNNDTFGSQNLIKSKVSVSAEEKPTSSTPAFPGYVYDLEYSESGLENVDVIQFADVIITVLDNSITKTKLRHFFYQLPKESLAALATNLVTKELIPKEAHKSLTFRIMLLEFTAGLYVNDSVTDAIRHCWVFLSALWAVGGACAKSSRFLAKLWNKALTEEFGVEDIFIMYNNYYIEVCSGTCPKNIKK